MIQPDADHFRRHSHKQDPHIISTVSPVSVLYTNKNINTNNLREHTSCSCAAYISPASFFRLGTTPCIQFASFFQLGTIIQIHFCTLSQVWRKVMAILCTLSQVLCRITTESCTLSQFCCRTQQKSFFQDCICAFVFIQYLKQMKGSYKYYERTVTGKINKICEDTHPQ